MNDKMRVIQGGNKAQPPRRYDEKGFIHTELEDLQAPFYLLNNPIALAEWNRLAPMLHEQGILRTVDLHTLPLLCQQYSLCVRMQQEGFADLRTMQQLKDLYSKFFLKPPSLDR